MPKICISDVRGIRKALRVGLLLNVILMKILRNIGFGLAIFSIGLLSSCSVTMPVTATSNSVGEKVGKAKSSQIIGFFFDGGDMSIQSAAKDGGISKISTVDFKSTMVLGPIFMRYETIVTGE